jgi:D-arabinose 1-dehydrogenase-like Zn-dependent alcohol dehydrogenase
MKVKTSLGGICHTDMSMAPAMAPAMAGRHIHLREHPRGPGAPDAAGEVVETGSGVSSLSAGDRVAYFPAATCEA